mmetsp:Transcript_6570/g.19218  ORF Transcript_6570/g.19218 Transcript_6570/m.19218 type:complete len:232 (+) Transcript_6570:703-1398(+)
MSLLGCSGQRGASPGILHVQYGLGSQYPLRAAEVSSARGTVEWSEPMWEPLGVPAEDARAESGGLKRRHVSVAKGLDEILHGGQIQVDERHLGKAVSCQEALNGLYDGLGQEGSLYGQEGQASSCSWREDILAVLELASAVESAALLRKTGEEVGVDRGTTEEEQRQPRQMAVQEAGEEPCARPRCSQGVELAVRQGQKAELGQRRGGLQREGLADTTGIDERDASGFLKA